MDKIKNFDKNGYLIFLHLKSVVFTLIIVWMGKILYLCSNSIRVVF